MNKLLKFCKEWWIEIILVIFFLVISYYGGELRETLRDYKVVIPVFVYLAFDLAWWITLIVTLKYTGIFESIRKRYREKIIKTTEPRSIWIYLNPLAWLKILRIFVVQTLIMPKEAGLIIQESRPKDKAAWSWFWTNAVIGIAQPSTTIAVVWANKIPLMVSAGMYALLIADLSTTILIIWRVLARVRYITKVRIARKDDVDQLLGLEEEAWLPGQRFDREIFESCMKTFPDGVLVAEEKSRIVGVAVTQIVNYGYKLEDFSLTWYEATDNGRIQNTHDPNGDTLYGVNLSVSRYASRNASKLLMVSTGKLVIKHNLKRGILGGRLPRYHKYQDTMTAEEYLHATSETGRALDPELYFYQKMGLRALKVLPNYFNDPESCNYGVLLVWENPFYHLTKRFPALAYWCSRFFKAR